MLWAFRIKLNDGILIQKNCGTKKRDNKNIRGNDSEFQAFEIAAILF